MKRARVFGVSGASIVVGAGLLWACSSSSTEAGGGGTGGGEDATTGSDTGSYSSGDGGNLTSDSGKITKSDGGTDGGGTGVCGATTTAADCYACCDTVASDGGVSAFLNLQTACICSAKHCDTVATCKDTLCKNPDVDDAGVKCNACQDKEFAPDAGDAGCTDPVVNECAADPNCNAGISCVVESNCNALP